MKKRINLFSKIDSSSKNDETIHKINLAGIGIDILLLVIFISMFFLNLYFNLTVIALTEQKKTIEEQIAKNASQTDMNYIANKEAQLKSFSSNDAQFIVYYDSIKKLLNDRSLPPLSEFKVDNKKKVSFSFDVTNVQDLHKLLSYIESSEFLTHFLDLKLGTASFDTESKSSNTLLQFSGTFKDVYPAF